MVIITVVITATSSLIFLFFLPGKMGCNASNHPPHNNPNVRSTSYSIFRRCRRRKKNKDEQNDEYSDEELKRKIDMVSGGGGGGATGEDSNKDISLSHHGFNFLGNSFGKNLNFYGTQDKMK